MAFACFAGGPTIIGTDYDTGVPGQVRVYLHWAGPGVEAPLQLLDASGALVGQGHVPALERGQYATTVLDFPTLPTLDEILSGARLYPVPDGIVLLDGDRPRRWNLLFGTPAPLPAPAPGERYVPFGDSLILTGFEGPAGDLEPGGDVTLGLRFLSMRPLERDYIVSTPLTGLNPDGTWAWRSADDTVDTVPALGAIPTLKWIRGSTIFDPHNVTIPDNAPPVPVTGSLVIYDHFTQAPLPFLDERLDLAVPLGTWPVASP